MKKYIKSITALNDLTLGNKNSGEIDRYAESDIFWATNKNKQLLNRKVKKGNIYQFEFGKNFTPEMSYEHRGLVIGSSGKLLYVLPICSYNEKFDEHKNAYHPKDNPARKSNYFLLKSSEFSFLTHDSVLKLNDIRTVSVARIKYKHENGYLDPNSDTYKSIEQLVFSKYFFDYAFRYNQLTRENEKLTKQIGKLKDKAETAENQLTAIKSIIQSHGFDAECQTYLKKLLGTD